MYEPHPSGALTALFAERPFQGVDPMLATFLFLGLDANYDPNVESSPIFSSLLEYHRDGVAFWQRHGVHHPFLLPEYRGDGKLYHRSFARIGFLPRHAPLVSFVELLHVPTVGRSQLRPPDLRLSHLQFLDSAIRTGRAQHIFISPGVARLMGSSGAFRWLQSERVESGLLPILYQDEGRTVYSYLHLSNYGRFAHRKALEARAIATLLPGDS